MSDPVAGPESDEDRESADELVGRVGPLDDGEHLEGALFASRQISACKGGSVVLGVTDRRLIVQPLDRRGRPDGERMSITPGEITRLDGGPAGGGWLSLEAAVMDSAAVR